VNQESNFQGVTFVKGVGAGMTHKQVCLLASLQVLGGQDPIYSKSVSPTYLDKNLDSSLATRNPLKASRNGQRREGGTTPNVPTARRKHVTESGCRSRFYNRSGPLGGALKKGRPIWVCNGWKVLTKKKVRVELFQCNWRAAYLQ